MDSSQLSKLLENITGYIKIEKPEQEKELNLVRQKLAASLLKSDDSGASFLLGESGIYSRFIIPEKTKNNLSGIAAKALKQKSEETQRAYVRYTPAISPLLAESQPAWAAGIKPAESFGPFLNADGRSVWFDFYPFMPLKALYMGGKPVIFYQAAGGRPLISGTKVEGVQMNMVLKVAGSVWLNAKFFLPDAAPDTFIGMKAKSGFIYLSNRTTEVQGKTTIPEGSYIAADLEINPDNAGTNGPVPEFGRDGALSSFKVPDKLFFLWNPSSKKIIKLTTGSGEAKVFGKKYSFSAPPPSAFSAHLAGMGALLGIPLSCYEQLFEIRQSEGGFVKCSGEAPLQRVSWVFPLTAIQEENTPAFQGSGGIGFRAEGGIKMNWSGLENQVARLSQPEFIVLQQGIAVSDEKADVSTASQHMDLWKVPGRAYHSTLDLQFSKESMLIAASSAEEKNEVVYLPALSDIQPDSPVEVSGEAVGIRAFTSSVSLIASETSKDIMLAAMDPSYNEKPIGSGTMSFALENALFKVGPPLLAMLGGKCSENFEKVTEGNLYFFYKLLGYLPTLPDPYLSSINIRTALLQNQFLISAVSFEPGEEGEDRVKSGIMTVYDYYEKLKESEKEENTSSEKEEQPKLDPAPSLPSRPIRGTVAGQAQKKAIQLPKDVASGEKLQAAVKLQQTVKLQEALKLSGASLSLKKTAEAIRSVSAVKINLEQLKAEKEKTTTKDDFSSTTAAMVIGNYKGGISEDVWDKQINSNLGIADLFALLDISSNANQMGVSLGTYNPLMVRREGDEYEVDRNSGFTLRVEGMELKYPEGYARTFMLPQIAWEPALNLTPPADYNGGDPLIGPMFYANDGGPSRIWNNNNRFVTLAPIPLINAQIKAFKEDPSNITLSAFTLPFGLKAVLLASAKRKSLQDNGDKWAEMDNLRPKFQIDENGDSGLEGGIQISLKAGDFGKPYNENISSEKDSPMFPGYTAQLSNLLDWLGAPNGTNNLGKNVAAIFNNEFFEQPLVNGFDPENSRGVPLTRMDMTGYGANIFSNWLSPTAAIAQTSQAKFDVMHGRTAHEVIQVKSILYPWGIRVVRTITLFRTGTAYIMRTDSGWVAESDGLFDFSYRYLKADAVQNTDGSYPDSAFKHDDPYELHPGVIKGLFNIRNIVDAPELPEFTTEHTIVYNPNDSSTHSYIDGLMGQEVELNSGSHTDKYRLSAVYFDADVEIENVIKGQIDEGTNENGSTYRRVVSKRILGYVQLTPAGIPLHPDGLVKLLDLQNGSIGGPLDCSVNVNNSNQQMLLSGFDCNPSVSEENDPIFVIAARGTMVFPKAGSWSVVRHDAGSGEVTPVSPDTPIPLIRIGEWVKGKVIPKVAVTDNLLRIAEPLELLRTAGSETINLGFLQTTSTQKALFLTPAFGHAEKMLLSKTPPIFADGYRLMMGETIFPNIGDAITNFGNAMPMLNALNKAGEKIIGFAESHLTDGNKKVFELLDIIAEKNGEDIIDQGVKLLQGKANDALGEVLKFDIPPFSAVLVEMEGLKIYVEYDVKEPKSKDSDEYITIDDGKLEFDIDSFAQDLGDTWLSRANNMSMVVDLGSMKRLITISGNFDAAKGKDTGFQGNDSGMPYPEIRFSKELQPVVDILQILGQLSAGQYGEAMKKGLQVAMSNKTELWEYKFEATKDLPTLRFPPTDELYNSAQTPLRLEATMSVGVYFNAALKVTTDPKQLLPTAGAFLKFHGGLEVMCVSVGAASVYAIGSVDVKISCDTKTTQELTLDFGFGVSIVASIPVVGNVSVKFMIAVSMSANSTQIVLAALMRFEGRASLAWGLVKVTILIEAKGIVKRIGSKTESSAQVTFGLDISVAFIIDISFSKTWGEDRQIA